ncbi:MAG: Osmotically inducible protein OsmC [Gammaproteobacteria bacterium]|nr:Osmotically inducible protein OsmC [Gammaproteobacteria bacterium]MBM2830485.1 Osmotically inducible protein OsmC [Gammaproteobacteria bacterium]
MNVNADAVPEQGDVLFDGGNLDCGSGLALLIRQQMSKVPEGGVLELRSIEPSVELDLPPWCRMVGHTLLGSRKQGQITAFFIRKGNSDLARRDEKMLEEDKQKAREYVWQLRTRSSEALKSTVYCRNFSFAVGQPASFEEQDKHPSAIEYLLGSLSGALCTAFATACSQKGIKVDDIELSVQSRINNILSHLGLEAGDPSLAAIDITCYASTFDDATEVRGVWEEVVARCPITQTLKKGVSIHSKLNII